MAIAELSVEVLTKLKGGTIGEHEAMSLAARARDFKHVDPILGIVAAYLYSRAGDLISVRQVAAHYLMNGQPIPYDVALLSRLKIIKAGNDLTMTVPALPKREARTKDEADRSFTTSETWECTGNISGRFPWLRLGWGLLDGFMPAGCEDLIPLESELQNSFFTTFPPTAGAHLAGLIKRGEV